jgi:hypothetical protein
MGGHNVEVSRMPNFCPYIHCQIELFN